jgi:hypothetical protein
MTRVGQDTKLAPADRMTLSQELARGAMPISMAEAAALRGDRATVQTQLQQVQQVLDAANRRVAQLATRQPPPVVTGVEPSPVEARDGYQTLTLRGSGFAPGVRVTLRTGAGVYVIPPERTRLISGSEIQVQANVTTQGAWWTAEVAKPDGQASGRASFLVQTVVSRCQQYLGKGYCTDYVRLTYPGIALPRAGAEGGPLDWWNNPGPLSPNPKITGA